MPKKMTTKSQAKNKTLFLQHPLDFLTLKIYNHNFTHLLKISPNNHTFSIILWVSWSNILGVSRYTFYGNYYVYLCVYIVTTDYLKKNCA